MSTGHLSVQATQPALREKTINTTTWGAGGTTTTITDPYISANSQVDVWVTGSTPQAGQWSLATTSGQCVITSSSSESSSITLSYLIF